MRTSRFIAYAFVACLLFAIAFLAIRQLQEFAEEAASFMHTDNHAPAGKPLD